MADWLAGCFVSWLLGWLARRQVAWLTVSLLEWSAVGVKPAALFARTSPNQNFDRDSGALRARVPTKTVQGTRARPSSEGPCACSDCGGQTLALIRGAIGRSINSVHVSPFRSPVAKTVKRYC